ncbi:MAG: adenylate/guanylate cyclase domain-containing protein [Ilumatobacteraceae bacterium]
MARLDPTKRADLPNTAFAYVDARGRRRLPIHDEAHVRNALARFSQVKFDDERDRERARTRLLNAAKKFGIVPVGFITGQLQSERELGRQRARRPVELPSGFVTMLMTDVEGSTALVHRLGDRYRELLNEVRSILRDTAVRAGGKVVETRADEFFAVFESPRSAVETAVAVQRDLRARVWPDDVDVRVRIGIHSGYPTQTDDNYIGVAVHTAARISAAAHGGQILVSADTREAARDVIADGVRFRSLGQYRLRGLPEPVSLFQVGARGLAVRFPAPSAPPVEVPTAG